MHTRMVRTDRKQSHDILRYLICLTVFFVLLEVSYFIQANKFYFSNFSVLTDTLHFPLKLLPGILYFLVVQTSIHFLYCLTAWIVSLKLASIFHCQNKLLSLSIVIWILGIMTALFANQYYYPNSKFAELTTIFISHHDILALLLVLLESVSFIVLGLTLLSIFFEYLTTAIVICIFVLILYSWHCFSAPQRAVLTSSKPNIFIIGIDSLRPDAIGFFSGASETPFIDRFLKHATVFSDAVTPIARTFPAWVSILTGRYPTNTGIRTNLANQNQADLADSLPHLLGQQGYKTIYASDETRFSNLDRKIGFDEVITPPMGVNDFLVGSFNDFPLSNLLINSKLGRWLFPYSYANRGVYFSYDPNSFLDLVQSTLSAEKKRPIFLSIHFCLPHFPYVWRDQRVAIENAIVQYQASITAVDTQVEAFFNFLRQKGLLNHAVIVLLSDHGEALELPGDRITENDLYFNHPQKPPRFYPASLESESINQSAGHGTDVLGLTQYHSLLAFQIYGNQIKLKPQVLPTTVSLLDIKPTLLALEGEQHRNELGEGGESLLPYLLGKGNAHSLRHLYMESDFSPEAIRTVYPQVQKVLLAGISLFGVDQETTRLVVKPEMNEMIIASKQYADIYGEWMLALYPQAEQSHIPILINLRTGEWTDDLTSSLASRSPASKMLTALKNHFGKEFKY